jgi:hypothetical protein
MILFQHNDARGADRRAHDAVDGGIAASFATANGIAPGSHGVLATSPKAGNRFLLRLFPRARRGR